MIKGDICPVFLIFRRDCGVIQKIIQDIRPLIHFLPQV